MVRFGVAVAVLLRNMNKHMSAVHHIMGQMLDHGGATDKVHVINIRLY